MVWSLFDWLGTRTWRYDWGSDIADWHHPPAWDPVGFLKWMLYDTNGTDLSEYSKWLMEWPSDGNIFQKPRWYKNKGYLIQGRFIFSLGLTYFCVYNKQAHWLPLFWIIFWGCLHSELFWKTELVYPSRIKNKFPIALEDRDNVSLPSKGQSCFLPSILKCLPLGLRADLLSVHYKRLGFPNLRLFLQKCDPLHV